MHRNPDDVVFPPEGSLRGRLAEACAARRGRLEGS